MGYKIQNRLKYIGINYLQERSKKLLTTSEPPPKMLEILKKRALKNGLDPSSKYPDQTWMRIQSKKISKVFRYTL